MAVIRLDAESCVFEGLGHGPLEQDRLLFCVCVRQCALPPAPGTQETQVGYSVPTKPGEGRARMPQPRAHSSRTTSRLGLSGRSPTKLGCRNLRSGVQL